MATELRELAQHLKATITLHINTVFFLDQDAITVDRKVINACNVMDYILEKPDPNRVRTTVGGNLKITNMKQQIFSLPKCIGTVW